MSSRFKNGDLSFGLLSAIALGLPLYGNLGLTPLALLLHVLVAAVWLALQTLFESWGNFEMTIFCTILSLGLAILGQCLVHASLKKSQTTRPTQTSKIGFSADLKRV